MSKQFRSGGGDHQEFSDLTQFDASSTTVRRLSRNGMIAVAAGVVLACGVGGGFAYVSSTPSADAAAAAAPVTTSTGEATSSPSASRTATDYAFSGRDAFDNTVAPKVVSTAGAGSVAGAGSTTSGSGVSSSGSSTGTATGKSTPGATSSSKPTSSSTKSPTSNPTSSTPVATSTPSTAAPWQVGAVAFVEIPTGSTTGAGKFVLGKGGANPVQIWLDAGSLVPSTSTLYRPQGVVTDRAMTDEEKAACEAFVRSASAADAEAKNRETKNCTVVQDFVYQPVFVPSSQSSKAKGSEAFGWVAAAGTSVPDAALGKVTGTVRWLGSRTDSFLVQVGNNAPQWVTKGASVDGTPLKFVDTKLEALGRTDIAVFSDGSNQYFTILGGGEGSGVTF